jgi:hypothetical protein
MLVAAVFDAIGQLIVGYLPAGISVGQPGALGLAGSVAKAPGGSMPPRASASQTLRSGSVRFSQGIGYVGIAYGA